MKQAYSVGELVKVLGKTYEIQQAELVRSAQFGNEPSAVYHLASVNGMRTPLFLKPGWLP